MPSLSKSGWRADEPRYTVVDAFQRYVDELAAEEQGDKISEVIQNRLSNEFIVNLSDDQDHAYEQFRKWLKNRGRHQVFYLTGFAGSGKTMLASVIGADFRRGIAFCAYTGKAASVLRRKLMATGVDVSGHSISTLHSLMYSPQTDKNGTLVGWSRRERLTVPDSVDEYSLVVVDEASMLTREALDDLLKYGLPILLIGDPMQLPPVKGEALDPNRFKRVHLTKIHRQAEGNPILEYSAQIRAGEFYPETGSDPRLQVISTDDFEEHLFHAYGKFGVDDVGVLSYRNRTRVTLNEIGLDLHRKLLGLGDDVDFFNDMPVMCLFNHSPQMLNGMRGKIVGTPNRKEFWLQGKYDFASEGVMVDGDAFGPQFGQEKTLGTYDSFREFLPRLEASDWRSSIGLLFDYGYAMTTHKSQGSSMRKVFVAMERPSAVSDEDFQKWLYTSSTRASEELVIVSG